MCVCFNYIAGFNVTMRISITFHNALYEVQSALWSYGPVLFLSLNVCYVLHNYRQTLTVSESSIQLGLMYLNSKR